MVEADLKEIVQKGIDGVVIPKVNSAKELKKIEKTISALEKKKKSQRNPSNAFNRICTWCCELL